MKAFKIGDDVIFNGQKAKITGYASGLYQYEIEWRNEHKELRTRFVKTGEIKSDSPISSGAMLHKDPTPFYAVVNGMANCLKRLRSTERAMIVHQGDETALREIEAKAMILMGTTEEMMRAYRETLATPVQE